MKISFDYITFAGAPALAASMSPPTNPGLSTNLLLTFKIYNLPFPIISRGHSINSTPCWVYALPPLRWPLSSTGGNLRCLRGIFFDERWVLMSGWWFIAWTHPPPLRWPLLVRWEARAPAGDIFRWAMYYWWAMCIIDWVLSYRFTPALPPLRQPPTLQAAVARLLRAGRRQRVH